MPTAVNYAMFDELFNNFQNFLISKAQEVLKELEIPLIIPEAAEPFVVIRRFTTADSTITKGGIRTLGETWEVEAYENNTQRFLTNSNDPLRNVILFEVPEPDVQECVLACQFNAKALNTEKSIAVSLGLRRPTESGTMRRTSWATGVSPRGNFHPHKVRAYFKKEANAATIQIGVQFESSGILEIRDIELLQAPVKAQS